MPETCRVSRHNKLVKLVHLFGFITNKYTYMCVYTICIHMHDKSASLRYNAFVVDAMKPTALKQLLKFTTSAKFDNTRTKRYGLNRLCVLFQYLVPHKISGLYIKGFCLKFSHGRYLRRTNAHSNRVRLRTYVDLVK
jgi:hypothetical protein